MRLEATRRGRFFYRVPAFLVLEKVYAEEAEKRMLAGKAIANPKANLPEGIGQARDKAAEMLNVYDAVSEGLPNWQPLDYLNAVASLKTLYGLFLKIKSSKILEFETLRLLARGFNLNWVGALD